MNDVCLFPAFFLVFFQTTVIFHFPSPGLAHRSFFLRVLVAFFHCVSGCCLVAVFPSG